MKQLYQDWMNRFKHMKEFGYELRVVVWNRTTADWKVLLAGTEIFGQLSVQPEMLIMHIPNKRVLDNWTTRLVYTLLTQRRADSSDFFLGERCLKFETDLGDDAECDITSEHVMRLPLPQRL